MQCLYCGKKLSLLRRLSDARFCSDAHREEYERQERDIALARLLGARGVGAVAPRSPGLQGGEGFSETSLPIASLLPAMLEAVVWRQMACRLAEPLAARMALALPESGLRLSPRGFPQPDRKELRPAAVCCSQVAATAPAPLSGRDGFDHRLAFLRNASPSCVQPVPKLAPAVADPPARPLPTAADFRATVHAVPPAEMGSCQPVLIVLQRETWQPTSGLPPAGWLRGEPRLTGAETGWKPPLSLLPQPEWPEAGGNITLLPRLLLRRRCWPALAAADPGHAVKTEALDSRRTAAVGTPLAGPQFEHGGSRQISFRWRPLPGPGCRQPAAAALRRIEVSPMTRPVAKRACGTALLAAPSALQRTGHSPRPPASHLRTGQRAPAWPAMANLVPWALPPIAIKPAFYPLAPRLVWVWRWRIAWPERRAVSAGSSRLLWHGVVTGGLAVAQAPEALPPLARSQPEWDPGAWLPLRPRAGWRPHDPLAEPAMAGEQGGTVIGSSAAALRAGTSAAPAAGELPPPPRADRSADSGEPGLAGRVPERPLRPVAEAEALRKPALGTSLDPCWASLGAVTPVIGRLRLALDQADGSGPRRKDASRGKILTWRADGLRRIIPGWRSWFRGLSNPWWIAASVPLLAVVAVYSFRAEAPNHRSEEPAMTAPATAPAPSAPQADRLNALQRLIARRAGIRLFDDFRSGLSSWEGREGWARTWRYRNASFVEPGELALLTPSLNMTDYTLTFLGQIERRSLNWVFRAKDLANYYSMRIVITRGGPLPEAALVRSVVLDGKELESRSLPLPLSIRTDSLYLVRMEIRGQDFTTYIQDQVVDHFSDRRLERGGVGFFSPRGDRALLRWVEVSHQYDYLGRLCALLSPYGAQRPPANGR